MSFGPHCAMVVALLACTFDVCAETEMVLYAVTINSQDFGAATLLRRPDGSLLARKHDLERWNLRLPQVAPVVHDAQAYFALNELPGHRMKVDTALQAVSFEFDARAFMPSRIGASDGSASVATTPGWGGFANYDVYASHSTGAQLQATTRIDGLFEMGMYTPTGALVGSAFARNLGDRATLGDDARSGGRRVIRLDTTWTRDLPSVARSLQLGDAIGAAGMWGRPFRYGGVRWATNFATRPGFVTFPLPTIAGEAALPATTELYLDGVLRQRGELSPGPFQLSTLPIVSGAGEARLVVRDILGREQVVTHQYYSNSLLLKNGLRNDSYELGFVRNHFGLRDADYGRLFAAATVVEGYTDRVTIELRGELLRQQRTVGAGARVVTALPAVVTAAGAVSRGDAGTGGLLLLGIEHQARSLSYALRSQWTTGSFTQLGQAQGRLPPRLQLGASLGFSFGRGTLGMSLLRQRHRGSVPGGIVAASYSLRLGRATSLGVSAALISGGERRRLLGITLVSALGDRVSMATSHLADTGSYAGGGQTDLQLQQDPPAGNGFGFRLLAGHGETGTRTEAGLSLQTDTGAYMLEAGRMASTTTYRLSAAGGLAIVEGHPVFSRRVGDAFAIVEVPEHAGIGIHVSNQLVARTNERGLAFVPQLVPYQHNPVRIDPNQLPLDSQVDADQVNAVPYFRSGLRLKFPVRRSAGGLLVLMTDDGQPVPTGAVVVRVGDVQEFPVAQRGEVFVTGLSRINRFQASWGDGKCTFTVALPVEAGPLPRLGPLQCSRSER